MKGRYIYPLRKCKSSFHIGNKAASLLYLLKHNMRIPETYVCIWDAWEDASKREDTVKAILTDDLFRFVLPGVTYAVRSSSNLEDGEQFSLSGQFLTLLNVSCDDIISAIKSVWQSAHTEGVRLYLKKTGMSSSALKMAVIIQKMVKAQISGISFSGNPLNGTEEVIVEAVHGEGTDLMQGRITPLRWIERAGKWIHMPKHSDVRLQIIQQVVFETRKIARRLKKAVDLEWVYDGEHIYWLQARSITTITPVNVYSNTFSREYLPGVIKPLVWSVNIPLVNSAWIRFFSSLTGPLNIDVNQLAKAFYYRAYFNMGVVGDIMASLGFHRDSFEAFFGLSKKPSTKIFSHLGRVMIKLFPRLIRFLFYKRKPGKEIERFFSQAWKDYKDIEERFSVCAEAAEYLQVIERLMQVTKHTAYYNIFAHVLLYFYTNLLKWMLKIRGFHFKEFDVANGISELQHYNPSASLKKLREEFKQLTPHLQNQIKNTCYSELCRIKSIDGFKKSFDELMANFGHLSDSSNDFSCPCWRENPELILAMITTNYHEYQDKKVESISLDKITVGIVYKKLLSFMHARTCRYLVLKEKISFLSTFAYGLFRKCFLAIGNELVKRGLIDEAEDIFYFYLGEVYKMVAGEVEKNLCRDKHRQRKQEIAMYRNVTLPSVIYGDVPPPPVEFSTSVYEGIAVSPGYYKNRATVVRGIKDYQKLQTGDVLVIPHSDAGLVPLFARAGAIVAESGGLLSHSSIVAREYKIPAVIQVSGVCSICDGKVISVDGYTGKVMVH